MKIFQMAPVRLVVLSAAALLLEAGAAVPSPAASRPADADPPILPNPSQSQPPQRSEEGAYAWHDGTIQYSYTIDCFTGNVIYGTGTYVGYWADFTNLLPVPNMVYYVHVVAQTVGNACVGPWGYFDLGLPPNTSLAISPSNPVMCYFNGVQYTADCPQTLPASPYNPGFYAIPSIDASWAWPMPYGAPLEFLVPVMSSTTLSGATLQVGLYVIDGFDNPWLNPTYGVYVFTPSAPGAFNKSSPANGSYAVTNPTLSWGASSGAASYEYCYDSVNDNACGSSWISTGSTRSASLSGLVNDRTYYWQVRAKNAGGTTYANGSTWWSFTARNQRFADVPINHWAWSYIERVYTAGITGGCASSPLRFCPSNSVTRAEMAIFLERGMRGSAYTPPAATGTVYSDVPVSHWAAAWIEKLAADGITSGCGGGKYCPNQAVTRAEMAIFLLRAEHGSSYTPPAATGIFGDVPPSYWAAAWIERLYNEGITGGCGGGNYCPSQAVTRAEMAVFLVRAFALP